MSAGAFSDSHQDEYDAHGHRDDDRTPSPQAYQNQGYNQYSGEHGNGIRQSIGQPTTAGPPAGYGQKTTSAAPPTPRGMVRKKLGNFVGFANLPDQVHRRSVR
jgi:hypothetical protein